MKTKFNYLSYLVIALIALSCSTTRRAEAQTDNYDQPGYSDNNNGNNDDNYDDNYYDYDNSGNAYNDDEDNYDDQGYNDEDDYDGYDEQGNQPEVNINVFVNELSPYGSWETSPTYGRVWVYNDMNFSPYSTGGHWAYTKFGWTWVSDYRWGWAPFHYGRWAFERNRWMWVPGYQWGPAWVNWRSGGDYYGWAPMGPRMGIHVGIIPITRWNFCNRRYITSPYIGRYCLDRRRNNIFFHNTIVIHNNIHSRYARGPERSEVERYTGHRVNEMHISSSGKPGNAVVRNNDIQMYRPKSKEQIQREHNRQIANNNNEQHNNSNNNTAHNNMPRYNNNNNNNNGQRHNMQTPPPANNNWGNGNNNNHRRRNYPNTNMNNPPQNNNQGNNQNNNVPPRRPNRNHNQFQNNPPQNPGQNAVPERNAQRRQNTYQQNNNNQQNSNNNTNGGGRHKRNPA